VGDIFMAAYSHLKGPVHKLDFFKLLVNEFGVQRECGAGLARPAEHVMVVCTPLRPFFHSHHHHHYHHHTPQC
jgi:hypothetical protein